MFFRPKMLILTCKTGGGHVSLAEALEDRLQDDYDITIVDPCPGMIDGHYRFVSRHMLWICAAEFYLTNTPTRAALVHSMLNLYLARALQRALDESPHDIVISTHPFYSYEVMQALKKRSSHVPFGVFFVDTKVHCSWLHEKDAAATFALTRESYQQALNAGFDPSHLHLVGWPVRSQFYRASDVSRTETLKRLNLDPNCFTVFLQGGAEGAARVEQTLKHILTAGQQVQVILATGRNQGLLEYFTGRETVRALPFTPEIAPYMAAADVVMGKAGANVIFESMTLSKPFIATSYVPAQEKANLEFIQRYGLGWVALEPERQRELIVMLANRSAELLLVSEKIEAYRQWNCAANESIGAVLRTLMPMEKFA
jgi:UDP-N-acetylglucosamine:LPS N-acetylglucosamine transferase